MESSDLELKTIYRNTDGDALYQSENNTNCKYLTSEIALRSVHSLTRINTFQCIDSLKDKKVKSEVKHGRPAGRHLE